MAHPKLKLWSRISAGVTKRFQDVELIGEVRGTDLDDQQFSLRLENGRKILCRFGSEQDALIFEALTDHAGRRLHLTGAALVSEDGTLSEIVHVSRLEVLPVQREFTGERPVWQRIAATSA